MPTTMRDLVARHELNVRIAVEPDDASTLDAPLAWAHSSDLLDPAPWLEPGHLLLTDGTQFDGDLGAAQALAYVARLRAAGVLGVGFATDVAHDRIPPALVDAARASGLALLEIADRTPFIAIIRAVADRLAAEQRERLEWAQQAQRAVARAALRPDGLAAVLRELERQLRTWVALFDGAGEPVPVEGVAPVPAGIEAGIADAVRATLRRGTPAGGRVQDGDTGATLQTLGRSGALRGVLAVGAAEPLDVAETDVVTNVIALASIALEQGRTLATARSRVRAGVFELLANGIVDVAERTARHVWGGLPTAPFVVLVAPGGDEAPGLADALEVEADRRGGRMFFAARDGETAVVVETAEVDELVAVLERHVVRGGASAPLPAWDALPRGLEDARRAAAAAPTGRVARIDEVARRGVLGLLDDADTTPVARRVLAAVLDSPNPDHATLLRTASVWLDHNGAWDPASRELGIHRHTLRNRLRTLERLTGLDLDRFGDRAELWVALQHV